MRVKKTLMIGTMTAVLLWAMPMAVFAEDSGAGLADLLMEAKKNNPAIAAARHRVLEAKALLPQAWGLDDPMLMLENDNARRNPFDAAGADQNRIGFAQDIPFPAKLFARHAAAAKELASAQAQALQITNDVLRDVKKAHAQLVLALRMTGLLEESRQALEAFRDVANRKYSLGTASQADVLGAEVEMGKVLNELTMQESEILMAQAALVSLMNRQGDLQVALPVEQDLAPMAKTMEELIAEAQKINPSLKDAESQAGKAEATLSLARWEVAPDLQFKTEFRQMDGMPDLWDGFLGVTVPLWGWKQQGMIAEAQAALEGKKSMLLSQKNEVARDIRDAYAKAQGAQKIAENLRAVIIPQSEQTLKVSEAAYENDKIDFLTLISYWRVLVGYRMDLYRAMAQYEMAMADLERAVGSSSPL